MTTVTSNALLITGLILSCANLFSEQQHLNRLNVDVYYESLCPDSVDFISNQLYPTFLKYPSALAINLIPYGKASQSQSPEGVWSFTCQHGAKECYGNKIMACAIQKLAGAPVTLDFVDCYMKTRNAGPKCANDLKLDYSILKNCAESNEGSNYLAAYGQQTAALRPKLSFVPTIVVEGVYSAENQRMALSNFEGLLCKYVQCL